VTLSWFAGYYREVFGLTEVEELASPHFAGFGWATPSSGFSGPHAYDLLRIDRPPADQVSGIRSSPSKPRTPTRWTG